MKEKGKRKFDSKEVRAAYVFLIPSLIGMVIFSLLPLIVSAVISLTDWNGLDRLLDTGFLSRHFVGLQNFADILTGQEFWKVLLNTIKFIVLYIPFMLCASLLVAFLLSRAKKRSWHISCYVLYTGSHFMGSGFSYLEVSFVP